jgi:putative FmdB family regulatory protein
MPTYVYELIEGECKICQGRFELKRPLEREALLQCPLCKKAVKKCISNIFTPKVLRKPTVSEAKSAGFTVYKKVDQGTYERQ